MPLLDLRPMGVADVFERLDGIDFTMIVPKLSESAEGPHWTVGFAREVQVEYKRFLALTLAYPTAAIVPSRTVDDFWHQHILDTRAYAADCDAVFGFFLHHYPYFGMNGEQDRVLLKRSFAQTREIYRLEFGSPPPTSVWGIGHLPASECSTESECSGCGGSEGGCIGR